MPGDLPLPLRRPPGDLLTERTSRPGDERRRRSTPSCLRPEDVVHAVVVVVCIGVLRETTMTLTAIIKAKTHTLLASISSIVVRRDALNSRTTCTFARPPCDDGCFSTTLVALSFVDQIR